jgi:ribosome biogenesis protein YTM1
MYFCCRFITNLPIQYKFSNDPINIASTTTTFELSNIINLFLSKVHHQPFDFLYNGKLIHNNLQDIINEPYFPSQILQIEYILAHVHPNLHSQRLLDDWVSAITGFLDKDLLVVSGSYDGKLSLFCSKHTATSFNAHNGPITSIGMVKNGNLNLITTSKDKTANLWSINPKRNSLYLSAIIEGSEEAIHTSSPSPSGQRFALGGWDCQIRLFKNPLFTNERKEINRFSYTSLKNESNNHEKNVKLARRTQSFAPLVRPITTIRSHKECVTGLSWSSESSFFSGSIDRSLRKWNLNVSSKPVCSNTLISSKAIICIATRPTSDENIVAFGCTDNSVRIWDSRCEANKGKIKLQSFSSHCGWVSTMAWRPNSEFMLASGSYDGSIKIWDLRTNSPLTTVNEAHKGKILSISWLSQGMLASGGTDCKLKLLKFESKRHKSLSR